MGKFSANIFWIATTLNYTYGPQQYAKISVFKVDNFVLPMFWSNYILEILIQISNFLTLCRGALSCTRLLS